MVEWLRCSTRFHKTPCFFFIAQNLVRDVHIFFFRFCMIFEDAYEQDTVLKSQYHHPWNDLGQVTHG